MKSVLATVADEKYLDQAKQLFSCAKFQGEWKGEFLLLAYDIPPAKLSWFEKKNIHVYHHPKIEGILPGKYSALVHLAKFKLFHPFFKKWDHVLYIDTDMIIQKNIETLGEKKGFWATADMKEVPLAHQFLHPQFENTWNFTQDLLYTETTRRFDFAKLSFNAGIFAFGTEIINDNTEKELNTLIPRYLPINKYGDQTIMNLYFYNKWNRLDDTFNRFYPGKILPQDKPEDISEAIIHFAGLARKPWEGGSLFYKMWLANLDRSEHL